MNIENLEKYEKDLRNWAKNLGVNGYPKLGKAFYVDNGSEISCCPIGYAFSLIPPEERDKYYIMPPQSYDQLKFTSDHFGIDLMGEHGQTHRWLFSWRWGDDIVEAANRVAYLLKYRVPPKIFLESGGYDFNVAVYEKLKLRDDEAKKG